jgi:hypothetical protein
MEWIDVNVKLPKPYEECIVFCRASCDKKFKVKPAYKARDIWYAVNKNLVIKEVSYWMPYPKAPDIDKLK